MRTTITTDRIYKVRDSVTGLFSMGHAAPKWNRIGKSWTRIGDLKRHILLWTTQSGKRKMRIPIPENWEILTNGISENGTPSVYSAREFVKQ